MPRDFLDESPNNASPSAASIGRDFLYEDEPQQEDLKTSLIEAPFRVASDIGQSAFNLYKNIPSYMQSAKTEVPGLFSTAYSHPASLAKQGLAGLIEAGHGALSLPQDIVQYGSNRLNLIPKSFSENIPAPGNWEPDINRLLGQPTYPGEALARGLGRNALTLSGVGKAASIVNPLQLKPSNIAKNVLNVEKQNKLNYEKQYDQLFEDAKNQNIKDLPDIPEKIDYSTIEKYTPDKQIETVKDFMDNPTLENAHWALSDLKGVNRKLDKENTKKSLTGAQRKQLTAVNNAINLLDKNMFVDSEGNFNNALLNRYKEISNGYRKDVIPYKENDSLFKYKNGKMSPTKLVNNLRKSDEFMYQRGDYHPDLRWKNHLSGLTKYLPHFGVGLGGAGLGLGIAYMLNRDSNGGNNDSGQNQ